MFSFTKVSKSGFPLNEITGDFTAKYILAWALTFVYSLSGEIFLFSIVKMNLKKCSIGKIRSISKFMESWRVFKKIQYTYCPISHEIKTTRQWNLVSEKNITREIFFLKHHAENEAGKLVPDLFLLFKEAWYETKASVLQLNFNMLR